MRLFLQRRRENNRLSESRGSKIDSKLKAIKEEEGEEEGPQLQVPKLNLSFLGSNSVIQLQPVTKGVSFGANDEPQSSL